MFAQKSKKPMSVNDLLGAVDAMRDQLASLHDERAKIENAPRPMAKTLDLLDAELDRIATGAVDALRPYRLRERGAPIDLALSLGLLVATNRDALRAIIIGQLDDLEQARPGLADADRLARLAEIDKAILKAELVEEYSIRQLERQGVSIQRRADASPLAVLAADAALVP